jgi:hypothetical protein
VAPEDAMFRQLTRGREHLHADLTRSAFECSCRRRFEIVRVTPIPETHRCLYFLRKVAAAT